MITLSLSLYLSVSFRVWTDKTSFYNIETCCCWWSNCRRCRSNCRRWRSTCECAPRSKCCWKWFKI